MQDSGSLAVFTVTARDQGHYKVPSGAFATYCNISCFQTYFQINSFQTDCFQTYSFQTDFFQTSFQTDSFLTDSFQTDSFQT